MLLEKFDHFQTWVVLAVSLTANTIWVKLTNHFQRTRLITPSNDKHYSLDSEDEVVETSVTNNSSFQSYPQPDDHTIRTTDTPGFKPSTIKPTMSQHVSTGWPNARNMLRPTMLRCVALKCCDLIGTKIHSQSSLVEICFHLSCVRKRTFKSSLFLPRPILLAARFTSALSSTWDQSKNAIINIIL